MRPRATMQQWPCTLWSRTAPSLRERDRDSFGHCTVYSGCLVDSNHLLSLLLLHEHRHTHKIKMPYTSVVNLPLLNNKHCYSAVNLTPLSQVMLDNQTLLNPPWLLPGMSLQLIYPWLIFFKFCPGL